MQEIFVGVHLIKTPHVWRCHPNIHWTDHPWWFWYAESIKWFLIYWDVINCESAWSWLGYECSWHLHHLVERVQRQIQIVEARVNTRLLSPIAIRHRRFVWVWLHRHNLWFRRCYGGDRDYSACQCFRQLSGVEDLWSVVSCRAVLSRRLLYIEDISVCGKGMTRNIAMKFKVLL